MNGFDFDGTLYRGDSTLDFYFFVVRKQPRCLRALPRQIKGAFLFALKRIDRDEFKECFYCFLRYAHGIDDLIDAFWAKHRSKIYPSVMERVVAGDLVISASPTFLLQPFCSDIGVELIASEVDKAAGKLLGLNCRREEKVRRFHDAYGDIELDEFYSDSLTDTPMAACATKSFLIDHGSIKPFPSV